MFIKKITSIYKFIASSINKMDKLGYDRPSLIYPIDINELIDDILVPDSLMSLINEGFLLVKKTKKFSYEKCATTLFLFERGLFTVDGTVDDVINLCCQVLSNVTLLYNDYEKNLNPHTIKKVTFKNEPVTEIYKDIIKALHSVELRVLEKSLIDVDM